MPRKKQPPKKALRFPGQIAQPVEMPDELSPELREIWPDVVHTLIDANVKLQQLDTIDLHMFCQSVFSLHRCRSELAAGGPPEEMKLKVHLEGDFIETLCALAGKLLMPHSALGKYLRWEA